MDAPAYAPASAFEPPIEAPYVLRLENVSLAELMKMPAAWAIVLKHLPSLKLMTQKASSKDLVAGAHHDIATCQTAIFADELEFIETDRVVMPTLHRESPHAIAQIT